MLKILMTLCRVIVLVLVQSVASLVWWLITPGHYPSKDPLYARQIAEDTIREKQARWDRQRVARMKRYAKKISSRAYRRTWGAPVGWPPPRVRRGGQGSGKLPAMFDTDLAGWNQEGVH